MKDHWLYDTLEAQTKSAEEERGRLVESVLARVGESTGQVDWMFESLLSESLGW